MLADSRKRMSSLALRQRLDHGGGGGCSGGGETHDEFKSQERGSN